MQYGAKSAKSAWFSAPDTKRFGFGAVGGGLHAAALTPNPSPSPSPSPNLHAAARESLEEEAHHEEAAHVGVEERDVHPHRAAAQVEEDVLLGARGGGWGWG